MTFSIPGENVTSRGSPIRPSGLPSVTRGAVLRTKNSYRVWGELLPALSTLWT